MDKLQFVYTSDCVPVVRCKDCKWRPHFDPPTSREACDLVFPKIDDIYDGPCPCMVGDNYYSWMPDDNWFCANGERRESE